MVCFASAPIQAVRDILNQDEVTLEVLREQEGLSICSALALAKLVRDHRPDVFMYAFNGVVRLFPRVAKLLGCRQVIYNDHTPRPENFVPSPVQES